MMFCLKKIRAVWQREFFAEAASPAAWVFLVIFLVLSAFLTFIMSGLFLNTILRPWIAPILFSAFSFSPAPDRRTGQSRIKLQDSGTHALRRKSRFISFPAGNSRK